MRYVAIFLTLLFASACSDSAARMDDTRFYAPENSFDIEIPYASSSPKATQELQTQSSFSEFEQMVDFQVLFGNVHRVERFKTGASHFVVDRKRTAKDQLEQAEAEYLGILESSGFDASRVVAREFKRLGAHDALIEVRVLSNPDHLLYRGVAFVITPNYLNLIQHGNPKYTEEDAPAVMAELERFYSTMNQHDI